MTGSEVDIDGLVVGKRKNAACRVELAVADYARAVVERRLVEEDIADLGEDTQVFVWARYIEEYDTAFAVDYDFIDATIRKEDIDEDESVGVTTLGELLTQLKKQNEIISE